MRTICLFVCGLTLAACSRPSPSAIADDAGPVAKVVPSASAPPEESLANKIQKASSLQAALAQAQPKMEDAVNQVDLGTILLAAWAVKNMKWSDVSVQKDETSYALFLKDPDSARGKRMCVSGTVIQIELVKLDFGKFFDGLFMSYGQNIYKVLAIGSTGTLVQNSQGRFCGVATTKYDYSNSAGGTGHAVTLVGMFDLPENKKATASP